MNQEIRNKLRNVVTHCRKLLEDSVSQELEGKYGIFAKKDQVTADPNAKMAHLTEEERAARKDILDHFGHIKARGFKPKEALDQLVREIAFTHLNRLCAYKMMEAREVYVGGQKFREAVSRGIHSNGVKFYLADHPDEERLFNTGHQDVAYRHFLDWLGGLLSEEIGVLFNPNDPANRLYPRQKTLDEVLDLLNGGGIKPEETELREEWPKIWSQDETIGWVYQYFTPKELRDLARSGNKPPANSYELAFRNQFFTPRYVVEFLTDNTLGRIWYEMRKGDTRIKRQCRFMVRRLTEMFLKKGEELQKGPAEIQNSLSQDELLRLPVRIPHRPKKDPRQLKILDPACGSGHFLLYCFDLLLTIYEEAYADTELGPALQKDYPKLEDLRRDLPRLILAHNLHGIDIDLRASQIAALALWLRCQRAYQEMGLKKDRTKITRTNLVCAEPMPGEEQLLKEFVGQLEPKFLGQVVEVVFDKMKLAGEAGSLLKIEEEIRDAVAVAKKQWVRETTRATDRKGQPLLFTQAAMDRLIGKPEQASLFDLADITDDQFFEQAEAKVIETLRQYAEKAQNGQKFQRRLFTEDAVRGFAFVDISHSRFDVVVMNPPFGDPPTRPRPYLSATYPYLWSDIYSAFIMRATGILTERGRLGAITSRTFLALPSFEALRTTLLSTGSLNNVIECGLGVLDEATVRAAFFTFERSSTPEKHVCFLNLKTSQDREGDLRRAISDQHLDAFSVVSLDTIASLPGKPFAYWLPPRLLRMLAKGPHLDESRISPERADAQSIVSVEAGLQTGDDFRFARCWWEVKAENIDVDRWARFAHSVGFCRFYAPTYAVLQWNGNGALMLEQVDEKGNRKARLRCKERFLSSGMVSPYISERGLGCSFLPEGQIHSNSCRGYFEAQVPLTLLVPYLNSSLVDLLLYALTPDRKHEPGIIARIPAPIKELAQHSTDMNTMAVECWRDVLILRSSDETDPLHWFDPINAVQQQKKAEQRLRVNQEKLDVLVATALGLALDEVERLFVLSNAPHDLGRWSGLVLEDEDSHAEDERSETRGYCEMVISHAIGVAFGRWDARLLGQPRPDTQRKPLDALPSCPPAMLVGNDLLPARQQPPNYPFRIHWDGILPDDPDHPDDLVRRVRDCLEPIWKNQADAIEKETCQTLSVKSVRDYFRKPTTGGFWDDHVSRYSKSRRNAPIYWLLQSSKRNYALWLYYNRFDKDLLFKALVNFVEPKIRLEISRHESLRSQKTAAGETGKEGKRLAKEVEQQEDFLSELRDFEDKLRRAADLHLEPDLDDGVALNIAPLRELVPWKQAKNYWEELLAGKYEWSSIGKQLRQKGLVK